MIRTSIAGVQHRDIAEQVRFRHLTEGERLLLIPEPDNAYDQNALKVLTEDQVFLGYVPARHCPRVLDHFDTCWATYRDGQLVIEWGPTQTFVGEANGKPYFGEDGSPADDPE